MTETDEARTEVPARAEDARTPAVDQADAPSPADETGTGAATQADDGDLGAPTEAAAPVDAAHVEAGPETDAEANEAHGEVGAENGPARTDDPRPAGAAGADRLAGLRAERDFLLRSIADLEAEHDAGELADERYHQLLDGYTVQAATVLRAIDHLRADDGGVEPVAPRRPRRVLAIVAVTLAVGVASGGLLVRSLGDRQPGQTITGNAQSTEPMAGMDMAPDLEALAATARDRPQDARAQYAYAQALLKAQRVVDALVAFDAAARLDPADPAPQAYAGWIVFLGGLPDAALKRLDAAVATDPSYPDARFFRGMTLLRGRNDTAAALVELREYVRLATPGPDRDEVQALVTELEQPTSTTSAAP